VNGVAGFLIGEPRLGTCGPLLRTELQRVAVAAHITHQATGHPDHEAIVGHVPSHDGPGGDEGIATEGNATDDSGVGSDGGTATDQSFFVELATHHLRPGVGDIGQYTGRAEEDVVLDFRAGVDGDIVLHFDIIANADSASHHGVLAKIAAFANHRSVANMGKVPNFGALANDGTVCSTAYTACPICVPSRMSLLTGQLPAHNGVYGNQDTFPTDQATFLHSLGAAGYETVLVGRMHFKGSDQRHGFSKRVHGDITHPYAGGIVADDLFGGSFGMPGCMDLAGGGTSPVLEYDRSVVRAALDYLAHDHDRPQAIVVGTYGPHFPYVAPPGDFTYYCERVGVPASWDPEGQDENPLLDAKRQRHRRNPHSRQEEPVGTELMLAARCAYHGMITEQDRLVGQVREAWAAFLERQQRPGVFVYGSDHGDTCGEHGIFGKQTFYEASARVPLVFAGTGIPAGERIAQPVSLLDVGPTLCALGGAEPPPEQDGISLLPLFQGGAEDPDRPVYSDWLQNYQGDLVAGRMVRQGRWKYVHYEHPDLPDQLFDVEADPAELTNRAKQEPDRCRQLGELLWQDWDPAAMAADQRRKRAHQALVGRWYAQVGPRYDEAEVWPVPAASIQPPEIMY